MVSGGFIGFFGNKKPINFLLGWILKACISENQGC